MAVLYPWYYIIVLYNTPKPYMYYTSQDRDRDRHYVQFETTRSSNRYNEGYKVLQVVAAALP